MSLKQFKAILEDFPKNSTWKFVGLFFRFQSTFFIQCIKFSLKFQLRNKSNPAISVIQDYKRNPFKMCKGMTILLFPKKRSLFPTSQFSRNIIFTTCYRCETFEFRKNFKKFFPVKFQEIAQFYLQN